MLDHRRILLPSLAPSTQSWEIGELVVHVSRKNGWYRAQLYTSQPHGEKPARLIGTELATFLAHGLPYQATDTGLSEILGHPQAPAGHAHKIDTLFGEPGAWDHYNGNLHPVIFTATKAHTERQLNQQLDFVAHFAPTHLWPVESNDPQKVINIQNTQVLWFHKELGYIAFTVYCEDSEADFVLVRAKYNHTHRLVALERRITPRMHLALSPCLVWRQGENGRHFRSIFEMSANELLGLVILAIISPEQRQLIPHHYEHRKVEQLQLPLMLYAFRSLLAQSPQLEALEKLAI